MKSREQLEAAVYDSLDAMMAAYAEQAVQVAEKDYLRNLDYSEASIKLLEDVVAHAGKGLESEDEGYHIRLWGGYFGEVIRRIYGGEWEMMVYPGGETAMPALNVNGSRLFPLLKVSRRLSMGEHENLVNFYLMVTARLSKSPSVAN